VCLPVKIPELVEQLHVHLRRDPIIHGTFGHIYEHSDGGTLGVRFENPAQKNFSTRRMRSKMRKFGHLGLIQRQEGESEVTWLLPPGFADFAAVRRILGIKKIGKPRGSPYRTA
jgi:hypothetical protein